jgi:hypothetical protein
MRLNATDRRLARARAGGSDNARTFVCLPVIHDIKPLGDQPRSALRHMSRKFFFKLVY